MFDLMIMAGFLFAAGLLYLAAVKMIDKIDPFAKDSASKDQTVYHIAVSDLVFLREIHPFLESGSCEFYTGSTSEILNDAASSRMDALIVSDECSQQKPFLSMTRISGRYYSSSLSLKAQSVDLQLLSMKPHIVTIYYQNSFAGIINSLISEGILSPVSED